MATALAVAGFGGFALLAGGYIYFGRIGSR